MGIDKLYHLIVGAVITTAVGYTGTHMGYTNAWDIGLGLGIVAGIGKEIYDYKHKDKHTPELLDAVATIAGSFVVYYYVQF